ncbi:MAG TPA: hypothetical protein VM557_03905 [Thermoanaerobaculia bacterium]|nr:hypothetical protein [Thermoanaerobaculia bacterium]
MTEPQPSIRIERLSPEQQTLAKKRDGILLSRKRVLADLETSKSPLFRRNLEFGLEFLDRQIAELDRALVLAGEQAAPTAQRLPVRRGSRKSPG